MRPSSAWRAEADDVSICSEKRRLFRREYMQTSDVSVPFNHFIERCQFTICWRSVTGNIFGAWFVVILEVFAA